MIGIAIATLVTAFLSDAQVSKRDTPHTLYDRMIRKYARAGRIDLVKALRAQRGDVKEEIWKQAPRKGTLWETYSERAAPSKGERGFRPGFTEPQHGHAYDGEGGDLPRLARRLIETTRLLMEEPEMAWWYADATDIELSPDENTAAWVKMADEVGIPYTGHTGRALTDRERAGSMEFVLELSMETDPMRWGARIPGSSLDLLLRSPEQRTHPGQQPPQERYDLRGEQERVDAEGRLDPTAPRPDPLGFGPTPLWLAEGLLLDSMVRGSRLRLVPVSREEATAFIAKHHSKLPVFPYRTMYAVGAALGDRLVAVATAGHPTGPWRPLKGPDDRLKRIRKILNYTFKKNAGVGLDMTSLRRFSRSLTGIFQSDGIEAVEEAVSKFIKPLPELVRMELEGRLSSYEGRGVDQRNVLELTRVASDGTVRNAASMLTARLLDLLPVSGRGVPSEPPMFVTYQLTSEDGTTYRALADRGLRPVFFSPGRKHASGNITGQRKSVKALADVDKIVWQAGPLATVADWPLLDLQEGERPTYAGMSTKESET